MLIVYLKFGEFSSETILLQQKAYFVFFFTWCKGKSHSPSFKNFFPVLQVEIFWWSEIQMSHILAFAHLLTRLPKQKITDRPALIVYSRWIICFFNKIRIKFNIRTKNKLND